MQAIAAENNLGRSIRLVAPTGNFFSVRRYY